MQTQVPEEEAQATAEGGQGQVLEDTKHECGVPPCMQVGRSVPYTVFKLWICTGSQLFYTLCSVHSGPP